MNREKEGKNLPLLKTAADSAAYYLAGCLIVEAVYSNLTTFWHYVIYIVGISLISFSIINISVAIILLLKLYNKLETCKLLITITSIINYIKDKAGYLYPWLAVIIYSISLVEIGVYIIGGNIIVFHIPLLVVLGWLLLFLVTIYGLVIVHILSKKDIRVPFILSILLAIGVIINILMEKHICVVIINTAILIALLLWTIYIVEIKLHVLSKLIKRKK